MHGCCVVECMLLVLVAAILTLLLYLWLVSWLEKMLLWADNATGWLLQNATVLPRGAPAAVS
jgi:hypothetical protein